MTGDDFAQLWNEFTHAAESGDGARFASHFTVDAVYHDYICGPHQGRADIAHMMQDLFHRDATDYRWEMFDPVFAGHQGYAWSLSSFTSTIPRFKGQRVVIDGMSRVIVRTGAGRAFCAGADMEALQGIDPNEIRRGESTPSFDMNRRADWQTRYTYYPAIPKPVIGMLNGATAGIGLVHALYCDLRFAA